MLDWFKKSAPPHQPEPAEPSACTEVTASDLIGLRLHAKGLRLQGRQRATSAISGAHHSRFRGRGMDYLESRCYQPGDDVRNMDWRVTARTGSPHIKLYQEERERPVVVVLDLGPSMFFATRGSFKSAQAARAAALIGWATVAHGDRIGALIFNGKHQELQPCGGQRGALRLIRHLVEATEPVAGMHAESKPAALNHALRQLNQVARPGSQIFIISDFYHIDETLEKRLLHLRRHNDLTALQIVDQLELTPPPPGRYGISDGSKQGWLDTRTADQERWLSEHHQVIEAVMRKRNIPLHRLTTTDAVEEKLRQLLSSTFRYRVGA